MASNPEATILLKVQDEASEKIMTFNEHLAQFHAEMDALHAPASQVNKDITETGNEAEVASGKTGGLVRSISSMAMLYAGVRIFNVIKNDVLSSLDSFIQYQNAVTAVNASIQSTGDVSGVTSNQAIQLAESMSNLTTFSRATVLQAEAVGVTFTNISTDAFPAFIKVAADMSTKMGGDLSQAVLRVGKALQDPINGVANLRREGVNLTTQQAQLLKQLTYTGQGAQAQKQILEELNREFGNSAEAAGQTFGGQLTILGHHFDDLKIVVGEILSVALTPLLGMLNNLVEKHGNVVVAVGAAAIVFASFAAVGLVVAGALGIMGAAATFLGAAFLPVTLIVLALAAAISYLAYGTISGLMNQMGGLNGIIDRVGNTFNAGKTATQQFSDNAQKVADQLKSINEQIANVNANFQEQLAGIVQKHEDKVNQVKDQITQEDDAFTQSLADRKKNFEDSLAGMVSAHQEKIQSIQNQIQNETASFTQANLDRDQKYQQSVDMETQKLTQASQNHIANIQEEIANIKNQNTTASKDRIAKLQEDIADEKKRSDQALADKLASLKANYDDQNKKAKEAEDKRVASYQDAIKKENDAEDDRVAKAKAAYAKDVENAQDAHDKKLAKLQAELNKETDFLKKHAAEVASVQNAADVDEITKLEQKHREELQKLEEQKQKVINNARQTVGSPGGGGVIGAFGALPQALADIGNQAGTNLGDQLMAGIKKSLVSTATGALDTLKNAFSLDNIKATIPLFAGDPNSPASKNALHLFKMGLGLEGRASGGSVSGNSPYIIGEKGPELFVPNSSGTIVPNDKLKVGGSGGGGDIHININGDLFLDNESRMQELSFRIATLLGRQNSRVLNGGM